MERIQKVIANRGYCSRRKAEELIQQGKVLINGELASIGSKVSGSDIITIEGNTLSNTEKEYILLYKPRGVVTTTSDDKKRKTVIDLVNTQNRLYPIGRLDYDTSGLLILTNDGELTNLLTHPKNHVEKVYIAKIKGLINKKDIEVLRNGVIIDNVKTGKDKARIKKIDKKTNTSLVELTIYEGKNHQVKNMFKALNYEVLKLKREKVAFLDLSGLKSGEYRYINPKEVKQLYNLGQNKKTL